MRHRVLAGAFVLASLSPSAGASTVARLATEYGALTIGGPASKVSDARFSTGHIAVTLASGSRVPVKAGDETVGFFFVGKGSFDYRSVDTVEHPIVQFNVKKTTSIKAETADKSISLKDGFTELLVLAANVELPKAEGGDGAPLDAAFKSHRETFARIQGTPASHPFIRQRLDARAAGVLRLEAAGGDDTWVYRWDSIDETGESLDVIRKLDIYASKEAKKHLWPTTISSQTVRDRRDPPPPPFLVTDITYTLRASNGPDASLSVVETVVPLGRPRSLLGFSLKNAVWDSSGTGYITVHGMNLRSVKTEDGASLPFHHDHGTLLVGLPAPAPADRPFKLSFEIDGDFLVRPQGDSYWLLEGSWLPLPRQSGRLFTIHATVRVKKPFLPFAPGTTKSRRVEGDENVLETDLDKPVDFPVVLAGKYHSAEETRDGLTVRVSSYALDRPNAFKKLANLAFNIVKYYEPFLGPFPLTELDIIEINSFGFGQAPPGTLFITSEAFNPILGDENQLFSGGVNHRFAHEIAHQYWGTVVKRANDEEQWIEEAFAEYCSALFIRDAKSKLEFDGLVARWKTRAKRANDVAPIPLANRIEMPNDAETEFAYRTGLLYGKGPYLLFTLHKELGDEKFLTFLKSYQKSFRWKFGTTKNIVGLLQFLTKKDYGPFFEANYWGTGMP